ncbi:MAG: FN3 associated domain-containing protein [Eubacteriales bacterium]|nr:FN3 associated domain-containing protein [Eubacteriales bacterium]
MKRYTLAALLLFIICAPMSVFASHNKRPSVSFQIKEKDEGGKAFIKLKYKNKKKGDVIRYTVDGKNPTRYSKKYKRPIRIKSAKVIKAQLFRGKTAVSKIKVIRLSKKIKSKKMGMETKIVNGKWILTQYGDKSGSQAMFYILCSPSGKVIVIDGGTAGNAGYVRSAIKEYGNVVDAWILTHPHPDHIGAFNEIYAHPDGIVIKQIYDNPVNYAYYDTVDKPWDEIEVYQRYLQLVRNGANVIHLKTGDTIQIDDCKMEILHAYDDSLISLTNDICNDTGLVIKMNWRETSMLFLADNCRRTISDLLIRRWGEKLKSDYVQAGHHGNGSFKNDFYDYVNPTAVFVDAPEWLLTGE